MSAPKARWRVSADGIRVEKVDAEGNIIEAPKTRYGSAAIVKRKVADLNRAEREAGK